MKIIRSSQHEFKKLMVNNGITDATVEDNPNIFYICLNSSGWIHSIPYFTKDHPNVINLYFDDVEQSGPKEIQWFNGTTKVIDAIAMNNDQADQLAKFIYGIPKNSTIYMYCAKGISRSGAVEDFINSIETGVDSISTNSNKHVYNSLRQSYARL